MTADSVNSTLRLYDIYKRTKQLSIKHDSYFHVYESLLTRFVGLPFTFLEIGVLNGGSLFMWREFFGPQARIIGVDLNPAARRWEDHGFEILTGDQASPQFWQTAFARTGPIDVLLDDGGHTNVQQVITVEQAIPHVRDGGLILVEDTHCSYYRQFGNPSRRSFVNHAKQVADAVNYRDPGVGARFQHRHSNRVASVTFFESIIALSIDSRLCFTSSPTSNEGESLSARDFRYEGRRLMHWADLLEDRCKSLFGGLLSRQVARALNFGRWAFSRLDDRRIRQFFD